MRFRYAEPRNCHAELRTVMLSSETVMLNLFQHLACFEVDPEYCVQGDGPCVQGDASCIQDNDFLNSS